MNMEIKVSEEIKKACPQFAGIAIRATVKTLLIANLCGKDRRVHCTLS